MNNIYLLYNFNNYFNRKLIRYDTLNEYLNIVGNNYININNVINFTPNDGIETEHVFSLDGYALTQRTPSYMLVCDDSRNIQQRWFVIDTKRTRAGQYKIQLYRDTVAESWFEVREAPIFVEKAIVDSNSKLIFNSEGMDFNQIKKEQLYLKDATKTPWIVGYFTTDPLEKNEYYFSENASSELVEVDSLQDYEYERYTDYFGHTHEAVNTSVDLLGVDVHTMQSSGLIIKGNKYVITNSNYSQEIDAGDQNTSLKEAEDTAWEWFCQAIQQELSHIEIALGQQYNVDLLLQDKLFNEQYKIIFDKTTQKFYKPVLNFTSVSIPLQWANPISIIGEAFQNAIDVAQIRSGFLDEDRTTINNKSCKFMGTSQQSFLTLEEVDEADLYTYSIYNERNRIKSTMPYTIFCMPYYTTTAYVNNVQITMQGDVCKKAAQAICAEFGGESPKLFDLQVLPYCPINHTVRGDGKIDFGSLKTGEDFSYIVKGMPQITVPASDVVGCIFWSKYANIELSIACNKTVDNYKLDNETKFYRLCSPNWNGQFEFSAAKNGGFTHIDVGMTLKPYQPYIRLRPRFNNNYMYGGEYEDARGLICGGKFDLPQSADTWATYERQNTNYNAIFNRQIENLEVNQKMQREQEVIAASLGVAGAAISGAEGGLKVGGGAGAVIGAAAGATLSGIAGAVDINIADKLRAEQKDYTIDRYNLSLQNIKAQPTALTNVGSLTIDNTFFPVLEEYDCTTAERNALINKIRYNGMTVGCIGTIKDYARNTWQYTNGWNYFKGKLIQAEIPGEDWHYVNTLKHELDEGIFIKDGGQY